MYHIPAYPQVGQLKTCARSSTDRAFDYGSKGWGFESLRARSFETATHKALTGIPTGQGLVCWLGAAFFSEVSGWPSCWTGPHLFTIQQRRAMPGPDVIVACPA